MILRSSLATLTRFLRIAEQATYPNKGKAIGRESASYDHNKKKIEANADVPLTLTGDPNNRVAGGKP